MENLKEVYAVSSSKISSSKSVKIFCWIFSITLSESPNFPGRTIFAWFAKILHFSYLCVKFQPTECIISTNFDHFASSFIYVRGVTTKSLMKQQVLRLIDGHAYESGSALAVLHCMALQRTPLRC